MELAWVAEVVGAVLPVGDLGVKSLISILRFRSQIP